jgi:hypothetical protein
MAEHQSQEGEQNNAIGEQREVSRAFQAELRRRDEPRGARPLPRGAPGQG